MFTVYDLSCLILLDLFFFDNVIEVWGSEGCPCLLRWSLLQLRWRSQVLLLLSKYRWLTVVLVTLEFGGGVHLISSIGCAFDERFYVFHFDFLVKSIKLDQRCWDHRVSTRRKINQLPLGLDCTLIQVLWSVFVKLHRVRTLTPTHAVGKERDTTPILINIRYFVQHLLFVYQDIPHLVTKIIAAHHATPWTA